MRGTVYVGRLVDGAHLYVELEVQPARPGRVVEYVDHSRGPAPARVSLVGVELAPRAPVHGGTVAPSSVADGWWRAGGAGVALGRARAGGPGAPLAVRLFLRDAAERWHLNDMHAGCAHQNGADAPPCPVTGYRWGSAWLAEPVPAAVLDELERIVRVHGIPGTVELDELEVQS